MSDLITACTNNDIELVKQLLEKNKNNFEYINSKQNYWNALMHATDRNNIECVRLLLGFGADPNIQMFPNIIALNRACARGHTECVKLLLDFGAEVNVYRSIIAIEFEKIDCIRLLLKAGANINVMYSNTISLYKWTVIWNGAKNKKIINILKRMIIVQILNIYYDK